MAEKKDTEVIIGGKVISLRGYESEAYLQKVASYINNRLAEYSQMESFRKQPIDKQNILIEVNLADDYFKAQAQIETLTEDLEAKEKELYDLKHELITTQMKQEKTEEALSAARQELNESAKRIVRLETELKERQPSK